MKENRWLVCLMVGLCLLMAPSTHAASQNDRNLYRVTPWNKMTDYFATVGKSERDKRNILRRRKMERKRKRLDKEKRKAQKERDKRTEEYRSSYISQ